MQLPHESVRAQLRRVEAGLVEISLVNDGELDISSRSLLKSVGRMPPCGGGRPARIRTGGGVMLPPRD